jgi:ketosteroid isomerase-like protein
MATSTEQRNAESWARALYADSVDKKDAAGFAAAFAEDGTLKFGNQPPLSGRSTIEEAITQFFLAMVSLQHEFTLISQDGNTIFLEAVVIYHRHDGGIVSVPAMTVFEMNDDFLATSCRIYVDLTPLFAPS